MRRQDQAIDGRIHPDRKAQSLTFAEGGQLFFENHSKPNKRSWKNDRARVNLMTPFFGSKPMKDITPESVEAFLKALPQLKKGRWHLPITDHTRNHYLSMLRTHFNWLRKRRHY